MRRAVIGLLGVLALLYIAYGVVMQRVHWRLVYPFHDQTVLELPGFMPETLPTAEGTVSVWVHNGTAGAPVVVYFMGNVGALTAFSSMLQHHASAGRSVVAMGYRGGGGVPGDPSEAALKSDALATLDALDQLVPGHGAVIIHGYSLGTGIATYAAAERPVDGVILSAPYARMCELMVWRALLPACQMPGVQKWQSIRDAARITAPVLVVHGVEDALIPIAHGERMAAALRGAGAEVKLVPIPTGGHADLFDKPPYLAEIDSFVDRFRR